MPSPHSPSSMRPRGRTSRPSSFHGRLPGTPMIAEPFASAAASASLRRPKTVPDLHAATRQRTPAASSPSTSPAPTAPIPARVPSKVLVSVTVLRSLGALQVVASTDWTVTQLVSAAVKQYVKEGRRPLLQGQGAGGVVVDPKDYALHYSQFSLQPIPEEEKLIRLGSRSFFLCPKSQQHPHQHQAVVNTAATASPPPATGRPRTSTNTCSNEAHREDLQRNVQTSSSFPRRPWLRFIEFLL